MRTVELLTTRRGLAVIVGPTEVAQRVSPVWRRCCTNTCWFVRGGQQIPVQWSVPSVTLQDAERAESLLDVRGALDARPEGAEAVCEFRATTMPEDQRVRLRWVRTDR